MRKQERTKRQGLAPQHALVTKIMYVFLFFNTLVGTFFVLDSHFLTDMSGIKSLIIHHTGPFILSVLITLFVNLLLVMIIGNTFLSQIIFAITIAIITFSNQQKMIARNEPIMPQELGLAKGVDGLLDMVDKQALFKTGLIVVLLIAIGIVGAYYLNKHFYYRIGFLDKVERKKRYMIRAIVGLLMLGQLVLIMNISVKDSFINKATNVIFRTNFEGTTTHEKMENNGYLLTFIYNIKEKSFDNFDKSNYNKKELERVIQMYSEKAAKINETRSDNQPNVIYILSESFIDPLKREDAYQLNRDPIPFIRQIMEEEASGETLVGEYGGGTANMEFELLTSFSMSFLDTIPYQQILPFKERFPSIASYLGQQDYETVGIHPFFGHFYERENNYPKLGFDAFIDEEQIKYPGKAVNPYYVSDDALLTQVVEDLADSEGPSFTMAITMQNHQPYNQHIYDQFIGPYDINATVPMTDEKREQMETYLKGLEISNNAFEGFIRGLNELEEDTVVVFFGDHYPGHDVYGDVFENKLMDYQTPLMIYSTNGNTNNIQFGTMSLNFVTPQVLSLMNMKVSPFYVLVSELYEEVHALTKKFQIGPTGEEINLDQLEQSSVYQDYELIQYDSIKGNGYAQARHFFDYSK